MIAAILYAVVNVGRALGQDVETTVEIDRRVKEYPPEQQARVRAGLQSNRPQVYKDLQDRQEAEFKALKQEEWESRSPANRAFITLLRSAWYTLFVGSLLVAAFCFLKAVFEP
jgi:hypothetical protein